MKSYTEIIARYAETDRMGIIHHSVYPVWFEAARTEYIRQYGASYSEIEKRGVMMPPTGLSCKYISPAYYEDRIIIETVPSHISGARITFSYTAVRSEDRKLIAVGTTDHGFVSSATFKPINVRKIMPDLYSQILDDVRQNG